MKSIANILSRKPEKTEEKEQEVFKEERYDQRQGLIALYNKEMTDHFRSKRILIVLALIGLTSFASLYGALSVITSYSEVEFLFLQLYTASGNSIPSFVSFIALLGPFVGLALGFDGIIGEKSERTLYRLTSQPIYRDSIINGMFLAGTTIIVMMVYSMGILIGAVGMLVTGIVPTTEEIARIFVFLLLTCVYICFWLGLALLFSVICKNAATSAMLSISIWLFFSLFMTMLVSVIANALYPVGTNMEALLNSAKNYSCQLALNRISPYYLFSEAVTTIMNPSVRTIGLMTVQSLSGAIEGYLSFGQSLLLIWPHLAGLTAFMLGTFCASYVLFMRQEIRAK